MKRKMEIFGILLIYLWVCLLYGIKGEENRSTLENEFVLYKHYEEEDVSLYMDTPAGVFKYVGDGFADLGHASVYMPINIWDIMSVYEGLSTFITDVGSFSDQNKFLTHFELIQSIVQHITGEMWPKEETRKARGFGKRFGRGYGRGFGAAGGKMRGRSRSRSRSSSRTRSRSRSSSPSAYGTAHSSAGKVAKPSVVVRQKHFRDPNNIRTAPSKPHVNELSLSQKSTMQTQQRNKVLDKDLGLKGITPRKILYGGGLMIAWWGMEFAMDKLTTSDSEDVMMDLDDSIYGAANVMTELSQNIKNLTAVLTNNTLHNLGLQEVAKMLGLDRKTKSTSPYAAKSPLELARLSVMNAAKAGNRQRNETFVRSDSRRMKRSAPNVSSYKKAKEMSMEELEVSVDRMKRSETVKQHFEQMFHIDMREDIGVDSNLDICLSYLMISALNENIDDTLYYSDRIASILVQVFANMHNGGFPFLMYEYDELDLMVEKVNGKLSGIGLELLAYSGNDLRHLPMNYIYQKKTGILLLILPIPVIRDDLSFLLYQFQEAPFEYMAELFTIGPKEKNLLAINPKTGTFRAISTSALATCGRVKERIHVCIQLNSAYKESAIQHIRGVHDSLCLYGIWSGNKVTAMQSCTLKGIQSFNENILAAGNVMVTPSVVARTSIHCIQGMYQTLLERRNINKRYIKCELFLLFKKSLNLV